MTLSNFSCLIGTETFHLFDVALSLLNKIDIIGKQLINLSKSQYKSIKIYKNGIFACKLCANITSVMPIKSINFF